MTNRKIMEKIYRYIVYFRRGHGSWLVYLMSFANFIVIQYRLLVAHVSFLEAILPSLSAFAIVFFFVYVPLSIFIGRYDIKKATVPKEAEVGPFFYRPTGKEIKVYYPVWDTILETLEKMAEKEGFKEETQKIKDARKILNSWTKKVENI